MCLMSKNVEWHPREIKKEGQFGDGALLDILGTGHFLCNDEKIKEQFIELLFLFVNY